MPKTITTYRLALPVYKQGDDLGYQIEKNQNLPEAFLRQASLYEEAARLCKVMAGVATEFPALSVQADTHMIFVDLPGGEEKLKALVNDNVLDAEEDEYYDDDEEEDSVELSDDDLEEDDEFSDE